MDESLAGMEGMFSNEKGLVYEQHVCVILPSVTYLCGSLKAKRCEMNTKGKLKQNTVKQIEITYLGEYRLFE